LVVDTDDPPYAKLVFRPTEKASAEDEEPTSPGASSPSGPASDSASERGRDAPDDISRNQDAPNPAPAHVQNGDSLQYRSTITSPPIRQAITVTEKPDRRSNLVEFSPMEDGQGFFDEKRSPITPTYEEQYWWPSPLSRSAHRRYHSTSSLGLVSGSSRRRRVKALQYRSSVGSPLSDKTATRRTEKWVSTSSIPIHEYGGHGGTVSRDALSMMEAAQHDIQSPPSTEYLLDEFLKPSTQGFSALSISDRQHSSRNNEDSHTSRTRNGLKESCQRSRESTYKPYPARLNETVAETHSDMMNSKQAEHHDVEAWLSQTGNSSGHIAKQVKQSSSSGLKKTKVRKERPSYINDWDEPRSYSPMEFRTPRAMTFEEIGALTAPVST
jgi:hypothetical protein